MKVKSDFVMHTVGGENIVVPVNERTKEFHGMIRLNCTGAFLWAKMNGDFTIDELVQLLLEEYDVDIETAKKAVNEFVDKLVKENIIEP